MVAKVINPGMKKVSMHSQRTNLNFPREQPTVKFFSYTGGGEKIPIGLCFFNLPCGEYAEIFLNGLVSRELLSPITKTSERPQVTAKCSTHLVCLPMDETDFQVLIFGLDTIHAEALLAGFQKWADDFESGFLKIVKQEDLN